MAPPGAGRLSRAEYARAAFLLLVLLALIAAVVIGSAAIAAVALALAIAVTTVRAIESWPVLVTGLLLVIFLIPIKRYKLPGSLPFDVEPYRLMVMGLTLLWIAALLVDRRVRLRRTMLDVPLLVLLLSVLASVSANTGYLYGLGVTTDVIKAVSFFTSFLLVCFVLLTVVVTERAHIERVIRVIVVLAALVSATGVVEFHTGFNPFNHLSQVVPILHYEGDLDLASLTRSDRLRVYASAQHPIALAGALAMILPLALYLAQSTQRRIWWAATFLVGLGALSTLSRTGVVALVVAGVTLLVLAPGRHPEDPSPPRSGHGRGVLRAAERTRNLQERVLPAGRHRRGAERCRVRQRVALHRATERTSGRRCRSGASDRCSARDTARGSSSSVRGRTQPSSTTSGSAPSSKPACWALPRSSGSSPGPYADSAGSLAVTPVPLVCLQDRWRPRSSRCRVDGHVRRLRLHPGHDALLRRSRTRGGDRRA